MWFAGASKWAHCKPILMIQAKCGGSRGSCCAYSLYDFAKQIHVLVDTAQHRLHHPQRLRHVIQRYANMRIMLDGQSLIRAPVHSLRLDAMPVQDARLPFKPIPDFVCPVRCTGIQIFPLAGIG